MRVMFLSYGTRGDAQPQVVLASELRERGYEVRVAAPENLRSFVEASGVEYAPLFGNSQEILESEVGRKWLSAGNVQAFMKALAEINNKINPEIFKTAAEAVEGADLIVGGTLTEDLSVTLAEKKGLPVVLMNTIPYEKTIDYPSPMVTTARLPFASMNILTHWLFRKLAWGINRDTLNPYRQSLGLKPLTKTIVGDARAHNIKILQLWSEHVLPRPTDAAPNVTTTGYIRMTPSVRRRLGEGAPPPALVEWLGRGKAPVYMGFGSMPVLDPAAMMGQMMEVATKLDLRLVISAGWTDLSAVQHLASERVYFVHSVDHSWLLPQCAAAVHHGGAGTTAASLEAGVPTLICSVFADQPFWGARVTRLGVGAHVPFSKLNAKTLTAGLQTVLQEEFRRRAAALGEKLRAEDGTTATVDALVRLLGASTPHESLNGVPRQSA